MSLAEISVDINPETWQTAIMPDESQLDQPRRPRAVIQTHYETQDKRPAIYTLYQVGENQFLATWERPPIPSVDIPGTSNTPVYNREIYACLCDDDQGLSLKSIEPDQEETALRALAQIYDFDPQIAITNSQNGRSALKPEYTTSTSPFTNKRQLVVRILKQPGPENLIG